MSRARSPLPRSPHTWFPAMSGIDGANATREAVILWRARYHDDRGEEWMQWGYWSQKNGANGYENKPGFDYEERLFIPQSSTADALAWELEAARDYHREAFEGDSSGLATDEHRAKANERLWAAVEAVLDVAPNPNYRVEPVSNQEPAP